MQTDTETGNDRTTEYSHLKGNKQISGVLTGDKSARAISDKSAVQAVDKARGRKCCRRK